MNFRNTSRKIYVLERHTRLYCLIFLIIVAVIIIDTRYRQTNLVYAAWRNKDQRNTDWSAVKLWRPSLDNKDFSGAKLARIESYKGSFKGTLFRKSDLTQANLRLNDFTAVDFTEAVLTEADLSYSLLRNAILIGSTLRRANLRNTELYGADFRKADLTGADFRGAIADRETKWPRYFDPAKHGVIIFDAMLDKKSRES